MSAGHRILAHTRHLAATADDEGAVVAGQIALGPFLVRRTVCLGSRLQTVMRACQASGAFAELETPLLRIRARALDGSDYDHQRSCHASVQ